MVRSDQIKQEYEKRGIALTDIKKILKFGFGLLLKASSNVRDWGKEIEGYGGDFKEGEGGEEGGGIETDNSETDFENDVSNAIKNWKQFWEWANQDEIGEWKQNVANEVELEGYNRWFDSLDIGNKVLEEDETDKLITLSKEELQANANRAYLRNIENQRRLQMLQNMYDAHKVAFLVSNNIPAIAGVFNRQIPVLKSVARNLERHAREAKKKYKKKKYGLSSNNGSYSTGEKPKGTISNPYDMTNLGKNARIDLDNEGNLELL